MTLAKRYGERTVETLDDFLSFAAQAGRLVERGHKNYTDDEFMRLAAEALLHRIGEAVSRLPEDFRADHPHVAWRPMRGLRNIVSHNYDAIDYEIVWTALSKNLPHDADQVRAILVGR